MLQRFVALAILLMLMSVMACGRKASEATPSADVGSPSDTRASFDPAKATATLSGKVILDGPRPVPQPIQMSADPYCSSHARNVVMPDSVVNADGTVPNVIVYVKSGMPAMLYPTPNEPITIDQKNCQYAPHVFTIMTGQPLRIKNNDATMHNIHAWAEKNSPFNFGQPVEGLEATKTFDVPEMPLLIRCDVHSWMTAHVGVFNHPFHTVTGQTGTFAMKLLPGKYEIEAWHASYPPVTQMVEVGENGKTEITFTLKRAPTATN